MNAIGRLVKYKLSGLFREREIFDLILLKKSLLNLPDFDFRFSVKLSYISK